MLRARGHDVQTVLDERLGGAKDPAVLAACYAEQRALVTLDLDFANIVAYPPKASAGLVVLRPARQSGRAVLRLVEHVLLPALARSGADLAGRLFVDDVIVREHA